MVAGQPTVKVMRNGVETSVKVMLGRTYGTLTEVTEGVVEGDEVVVPIDATQNRGNAARASGAPRSGGSLNGGNRPSAGQTSR